VNWSHTQPRRDVVCPSCIQYRRRLAGAHAYSRHLLTELQKTQALLAGALDRIRELGQSAVKPSPAPNATNSSIPPSANPIGAPRPVVKKPTGRRPGGQIGHRGVSHKLLPLEKVNQVVQHRPASCRHCHYPLDSQSPGQLVGRHQVAELPKQAITIIEHQSYCCRCDHCGKETRGMIPPEIAVSTTGPRLTAAIGIWGAWVKGSRRAVAEVVGRTLGSPIALGSISNRERELSDALHPVYTELTEQMSLAPVKYADETGWKLHGQDRWLFVAADQSSAVFRIEKARTRVSLMQLLNEKKQGFICSDRHGIYDLWPLNRRQLCWAHLKRDFVAMSERGGVGEVIGRQLLEITAQVFALWRGFHRHQISRKALRRGMAPLRKRMKEVLESGADCGQKKTTGLCKSLLKREKALWRFVPSTGSGRATVKGLEPTNNLAERMLRPAVIWRKKSFGSHSLGGCRYAERMLSVIQTLRLRGLDVLDYLSSAVQAHRKGLPPPAIPSAARNDLAKTIERSRHEDGTPGIPKLRKVA
jgi:transposase